MHCCSFAHACGERYTQHDVFQAIGMEATPVGPVPHVGPALCVRVRNVTWDPARRGQRFERRRCSLRQELLSSVLEGYATTVLAYGQTGSGKTYRSE